jgi:hypothetical protein
LRHAQHEIFLRAPSKAVRVAGERGRDRHGERGGIGGIDGKL